MTVPFWRWRPWLLNGDGAVKRVLVLARGDQVELAELMASILDQFHPEWEPAAVVVGDAALAVPLAGDDARTERMHAGTMLGRFRLLRPLPMALIDLTGDAPEYEVFRETYRRAEIPVIQPGHSSGDPDQISLWRLTELLTTLGGTLAHLATAAQSEEKSRYGSDAGWNHIWKSISVKNVLW